MQGVILADCVFICPFLSREISGTSVLYSRAGASVGFYRSLLRKHERTHNSEVHFRFDRAHAQCACRSKHRGKREARVLMSAVRLR